MAAKARLAAERAEKMVTFIDSLCTSIAVEIRDEPVCSVPTSRSALAFLSECSLVGTARARHGTKTSCSSPTRRRGEAEAYREASGE